MTKSFLILAAGVIAAAVLVAQRAGAENAYRVDAVFDTAKGIVPGQLVKIAGVRVGKVETAELTAGTKARLGLSVDREFAPFRSDARCRILPEGIISENFVECDPGSAADPLPSVRGTPTVALERTAVPVSLQDVIDIFSLPVAERVRALINELGLGTAGRGEDLNEVLRRANPALTESRRVLAILRQQRRQMADAIVQTDTVLARLASRRGDVRRFVDRASSVTRVTAAHADPLGEAIHELPPMFTALDRALASLRKVSDTGTPLVRKLRAAAPGLTEFTRALPPFARAGLPAVRRVGSVAAAGRPDVRVATPVLGDLKQFARTLKPTSRQIALLFDSLAKQGGIEAVMRFFYQMAAMSGGYDRVSHYVAVVINVWTRCLMDLKAPGCSQAYSAPGNGTIPANAPSVGPQRLGTVLAPGTPVEDAADGARAVRKHPKDVKRLLDFLLK